MGVVCYGRETYVVRGLDLGARGDGCGRVGGKYPPISRLGPCWRTCASSRPQRLKWGRCSLLQLFSARKYLSKIPFRAAPMALEVVGVLSMTRVGWLCLGNAARKGRDGWIKEYNEMSVVE